MKKHTFLAGLALALALLPYSLPAQEITVLSYNIYHGERPDGSGQSNLEDIAKVIETYAPDFVVLQEVDSMTGRSARFHEGIPRDLARALAERTTMHGYFGKAMDYDGGGYGEGLLSRVPETPVVYDLPIPAGGEPRAMIAVEHTFPNGEQMLFAGTHLCHEFEANQLAQALEVADILTQSGLPAIAAGDFNITPDSEAYRAITGKLVDAAVAFGDPMPTYPSTEPEKRIDYVFFSPAGAWRVVAVQVIPSDASDHLPLLVTLELGERVDQDE